MKRNLKSFFGVFLLGLFTISCGGSGESIESITKKVNDAIEEGDYAKAYTYIDPYYTQYDESDLIDGCCLLNEKILKHEIASLVESDNNGSNAAMIIFAISEREKYNDYSSSAVVICIDSDKDDQKNEMISYAIDLAQAAGKEVLAERLAKKYTKDEQTTYDDDDE